MHGKSFQLYFKNFKMTQFETYLLLFTDVLVSNFAFNFSHEIAFDSMSIFGTYDIRLMILSGVAAYTISVCINYLLGGVCYKILAPADKNQSELSSKIEKLKEFKFLPLIIALSCLPFFGKFIILFSGFCRIKFKLVFFISILTKLIYYILLS